MGIPSFDATDVINAIIVAATVPSAMAAIQFRRAPAGGNPPPPAPGAVHKRGRPTCGGGERDGGTVTSKKEVHEDEAVHCRRSAPAAPNIA
mmetsp:Transcript_21779/g.33816  ORF Transcript_21779/g.33816 Transcript_21779/m.33816 type:complete len:91 (+) Transcript_21779:216-488(+)